MSTAERFERLKTKSNRDKATRVSIRRTREAWEDGRRNIDVKAYPLAPRPRSFSTHY